MISRGRALLIACGRPLGLLQTGERVARNGWQIRYVRSTFLPDQSRCICIFESSSRDLVRKVNETAQIPFTRIEAALDFSFLAG